MRNGCGFVWLVTIAGYKIPDVYTSQLRAQQVAFVHEQDELGVRKKRRRADRLPQDEGIFETVDSRVLFQRLIEAGDRTEKEDYVRVLEKWEPGVSRSAATSDIVHSPFPSSFDYCVDCE